MSNSILHPLIQASLQTLYIVFASSIIALSFGLLLGIILFASWHRMLVPKKTFHSILSSAVNISRSIPYIILMIALIPFTRWLIGTSIGIDAAIVPLALAGIPFYAKIVQNALDKVQTGVIEAALSMGASKIQIIFHVLLPESKALLIQGATLTIIAIIGYSAMAGAVGGGGLGDLAMRFGYWRFEPRIMLWTILILVALVQVIQLLGDKLAKEKPNLRLNLCILFAILFCLCFVFWPHPAPSSNTLKVGIIQGPQSKVMKVAEKLAQSRYHLYIQTIAFEDYVLPNTALENGDIDVNMFQHKPFLQAQMKKRGYHLVPIARTFVFPMGLYSKKIQHIDQLADHAIVSIPNDPSNEGRALMLLEKAHLIKLKKGTGILGTLSDITANPKDLQFKLLSAPEVAHALEDVDLGAINNDYLALAHLKANDALLQEDGSVPYANIIVARKKNAQDPRLKTFIKIMHSSEVVAEVHKIYPHGGAIAAWRQ